MTRTKSRAPVRQSAKQVRRARRATNGTPDRSDPGHTRTAWERSQDAEPAQPTSDNVVSVSVSEWDAMRSGMAELREAATLARDALISILPGRLALGGTETLGGWSSAQLKARAALRVLDTALQPRREAGQGNASGEEAKA